MGGRQRTEDGGRRPETRGRRTDIRGRRSGFWLLASGLGRFTAIELALFAYRAFVFPSTLASELLISGCLATFSARPDQLITSADQIKHFNHG